MRQHKYRFLLLCICLDTAYMQDDSLCTASQACLLITAAHQFCCNKAASGVQQSLDVILTGQYAPATRA